MTTKTKKNTVVLTAIAVFAVATVLGSNEAFATHVSGVEDYEWHIWSRTSADGHLSYLDCDGSNDYCKMKIKTLSSVSNAGVSQSLVNVDVDSIDTTFDAMNKKMTIDRVTTSDSYITASNLASGTNGKTEYEMHCTNWFIWCQSYDSHFVKMKVRLNDDSNEVVFKSTEDENANPQEFDVKKTLTHELFHAMGVDHNTPTDSVVHITYEFGATNGYTPNTGDKSDLGNRYP